MIDWTKVITVEDKFQQAKEAKKAEIKQSFNNYIRSSFICSLGYPMQFNESDSLKMEGAIKLMEISGQTEGYLTDADDITHYNISLNDIKRTQLEMLAKFAEAHAKKQLFRIQIDSATTQEELDNIKWNI